MVSDVMVSGVQAPSFSLIPESYSNNWEDVRDLCAAYGLVLDEWQENVLAASLGELRNGKWSASRVGMSVPRQNGKTAVFEARELAGLVLFGEQLIIHSAHLVPTAMESFHRIKTYFDNYDDLRRKVARVREANGDQSIEMMSGQRLLFKARARGGGRGFSASVLMLDEAQILPARAWAAMLPSKSAHPNPQIWLAGTPPGPEDDGEVFGRLRSMARIGTDKRLCWMEWFGTGDPADPVVQATANPGFPMRPTPESISDELTDLSVDEFARERLGQWPDQSGVGVFPRGAWDWCKDPDSVPASGANRLFAVDVAADQSWSAVSAAVLRDDGLVHGQVVDYHRGTGWVVSRVLQLLARWGVSGPVVLCGRQAAALRDAFEVVADGEVPVEVLVMSLADKVAAAARFYDAVVGTAEHTEDDVIIPAAPPSFRHLGQQVLDVAVDGARWKDVAGDGRVWASDGVDLSPIRSVSAAVWALSRDVEVSYDVALSIY